MSLNGNDPSVRRCTVFAVSIWIAAFGNMASGAGDEHRLTILHTNDLLGGLLPEPYFDEGHRGGFARLAYLLEAERDTRPDSLLIVDGGNALGDSPLAGVDAGRMAVRLMNSMSYDAMVVGNHEFDYGLDSLRMRASEARFHMLGANVRAGEDSTSLFGPYVLVQRSGLKIALAGLLSPQALEVVNPVKNPALQMDDLHEVLKTLLEGPAGSADLRVVLVHMGAREAMDLARAFPQVDLFIAGGFSGDTRKGAREHVVRFAEGGYLVTTPGKGAFLGRVDLTVRREEGRAVLVDVLPRLIPVGVEVPRDQTVAALVDQQQEILERTYQQEIGHASDPVEDTAQWVADLMRTRLDTEVSVINQGTLRPVALEGEIKLGTLVRLVRYDDAIVPVVVYGQELLDMAASSTTRSREGQRLVFSGFDPVAGTIGGRPLVPEEKYRVATTSYLAAGGDSYWTRGKVRRTQTGGWITLKQMLEEHIRRHPGLGRWDGVRKDARSVWKNHTRVTGSLSHTALDASAGSYSGVSYLGGQDDLSWNGQFDSRTTCETGRGTLTGQLRTGFGQVRVPGGLREGVDRIDGEVGFAWSKLHPAPFFGIDLNTVWTASRDEKHPLALRFKGGLQKKLGGAAGVRIGLAIERDRARAANTVGLELAPELKGGTAPGSVFSSQAKLFWGVNKGSVVSLQNFNSLSIRLLGNLAATLDANLFLYRGSQVRAVAVKSELNVGLGYSWSAKWL